MQSGRVDDALNTACAISVSAEIRRHTSATSKPQCWAEKQNWERAWKAWQAFQAAQADGEVDPKIGIYSAMAAWAAARRAIGIRKGLQLT